MITTMAVSTTATSHSAHDVVARLSFELVGVALLAIIADSNETLGSIILILMVAFLVYWLITRGAGIIARYIAPYQPTSHTQVQ